MNTRCLSVILALFLAFVSTGCTVVSFSQPVGTPSEEAAKQLQGIWLLEDSGVIYVHPLNDGRVIVASVEGDKDDLKLNKTTCLVTQLGEDKTFGYLHIPTDSAKDLTPPARMSILRVKADDHKIVAWGTDFEHFKSAVKDGSLPGSIEGKEGNHVKVTADKPTLDAYFIKHGATLFKRDDPVIVTRIGPKPEKDASNK